MGRRVEQLELALKETKLQLAKQHLRSFEAAKVSRRTDNWFTNGKGPNADLRLALQRIVARHQDLVDSDPWASKAISVVTNNWVGDGIMGTPRRGTRRYVTGFTDWAESVDCDWDGLGNFYAKQSLVARTVAVRGSCLVRRRFSEELMNRGLVPLQIQVMEPDFLDLSKDDGARIRFGKQYKEDGRLEGYWIRRSHPGESDWTASSIGQSDFVPASEICHVYDVRRPGQATGVPFGVAALLTLRDISDRDAAQMMKDKLSACFMAFLEDTDPDAVASGQQLLDSLEPGVIEPLPPGKNVRFAVPPGSGDYVATQRYHLCAVAQAYEITYEALTGDLSNVNFSSGRMGWMEMRRAIARWRWAMLIPQFLNPVARWFQEAAAVSQMGAGAAQFEWTPPAQWLVDPAREIPAYIDAVRAGFMSLSEVQRMLGYVPSLVIQELGFDMENARAAGLKLDVDLASTVGTVRPVDNSAQSLS